MFVSFREIEPIQWFAPIPHAKYDSNHFWMCTVYTSRGFLWLPSVIEVENDHQLREPFCCWPISVNFFDFICIKRIFVPKSEMIGWHSTWPELIYHLNIPKMWICMDIWKFNAWTSYAPRVFVHWTEWIAKFVSFELAPFVFSVLFLLLLLQSFAKFSI